MTTRTHGLMLFAGSAVAGVAGYWFLFHFLAGASGHVRLPAYPLALPLVGTLVGLLETVTGSPIKEIDQGWQRLPVYVKVPVGLVGGVLVLWAFLWIVWKSLAG